MNKYYLQINLINKNNKKIITNYELYNNGTIIKQFDDNDTKKINKIIKDYKSKNKLDIKKSNDNYKIYDVNFLKKYIGIPSNKITHINKYSKKIALLSTLAIGFISTSVIDHKVNPDLYNNTTLESNIDNDDEIDFVYIDNTEPIKEKDPTPEEVLNEIDTPLIYTNEENKNDNYKIIYYSDNDDNINENTLPSEKLSSNIYTYSFDYENRSNDESIQKIIDAYSDCIRHCSDKYGMDPRLIIAMICQENPRSDVNYSSVGGVGLLQVERQIWNGYTMNDINGTPVTINCDEINNISNDYYKMNQVALFQIDLKNKLINEEDYTKYDITKDDIQKFKNAEKSIEIGCMIFEYCENQILNNNKKNIYNYKLTDEECELLSIWAHNKGINQVETCLKNTNSFEETINMIKTTPYGDNEYLEHVISFLPKDTVINMRTRDNNMIVIKMENNLENNKTL